jgi:hypothetical protein
LLGFVLLIVELSELHEKIQSFPIGFTVLLDECRPAVSTVRIRMSIMLGDELVKSLRNNLVELSACFLAKNGVASQMITGEECNEAVKMIVTVPPKQCRAFENGFENTFISLCLWGAVDCEAFVKRDAAFGIIAVERERKKHLRRHSLEAESRRVPESELSIIFRMPHQAAAPGSHGLQPRQPLPDQRLADAPSLEFRQDGNRPQPVPVRGAVRKRQRRKGDVSDDTSLHFRDKRQSEGTRNA